MAKNKFEEDLADLCARISPEMSQQAIERLEAVKTRLFELHDENLVKINHSAMELVCAHSLILAGYKVVVEEKLSDLLVCDVLGIKGDGKAIVEVETGFVPPDHALDPTDFFTARVTSKIARYSPFSEKFILGAPPYCVLPIPELFQKPPGRRTTDEVGRAKNLCDRYYSSPPVTLEEIRNARLHSIHIIDVDRGKVREMDPEAYLEANAASRSLIFP